MSGHFWGSLGSGIDLNYSFIEPGSKVHTGNYNHYAKDEIENVLQASTAFKSAVSTAFGVYSSVSLLNFHQIDETNNKVGHIRLGTSNYDNIAWAFIPYVGFPLAGDTWFNYKTNADNNSTYVKNGTYWSSTISHEIGHTLGLAHPHDAMSYGGRTYGEKQDYGTVNNAAPYSTIAYAEYIGEPVGNGASNQYSSRHGLMINDIKAIQYLYGVNEKFNDGDNIYTVDSLMGNTLSKDYFGSYLYTSIWDAGGTDTFSWSDQTSVASINLNPGTFSKFGKISGPDDPDLANLYLNGGDGLLGIAYDCIIENAKGGKAADNIKGNNADNKLYGGSGAGVKDTLTGNGGADTFVCTISDAITNINSADIVTDFTNGTDKIGLEDKSFSDLTISQVTSGAFSGDTKIADTSSGKILLLLDDTDVGLLDSSDFITTDFV